jgi:hypothetical protein
MKLDDMSIKLCADISGYLADIEQAQSLSLDTMNRIEKKLKAWDKVWDKWQAAVDRAYFKLKPDQ